MKTQFTDKGENKITDAIFVTPFNAIVLLVST